MKLMIRRRGVFAGGVAVQGRLAVRKERGVALLDGEGLLVAKRVVMEPVDIVVGATGLLSDDDIPPN